MFDPSLGYGSQSAAIVVDLSSQAGQTDLYLDFWARREPIPWVRIYKVADHVKFPHMRHVAKDAGALECQECHGVVEEMDVIEEVEQPLKMGWCVECHRKPESDASVDCTVCHY